MPDYIIKDSLIVNHGESYKGSVCIKGNKIERIIKGPLGAIPQRNYVIIDASSYVLIPGVIDMHVHFREPGLTHKATIATETAAAIAGGITSFADMPNTNPQTTSHKHLQEKYQIGATTSLCNYSFYLGATDTNMEEIEKCDPAFVPGIKVFMGSSTGNMMVSNKYVEKIFAASPVRIVAHCEDENIIRNNLEKCKAYYGESIPFSCHPQIRSEEACYVSTHKAIELAQKHHQRLHIAHVSTKKECDLLTQIQSTGISAEVCVAYLLYSSKDYAMLGSRIKCNPAIKDASDQEALLDALQKNIIPMIATDHAPHSETEKQQNYLHAPSGIPIIQYALHIMLDLYKKGKISLEQIVQKMCHAPADIFGIAGRGYIREGSYADIVLIDMQGETRVEKKSIIYKCGWSPLEGQTFGSRIVYTFVNGQMVYEQGKIHTEKKGMQLQFTKDSLL